MKKSIVCFFVLFIACFCASRVSLAVDVASVKVTGDTVSQYGIRYYTVETRDTDGNGTDWRLMRERIENQDTGEVTKDVVLRPGDKWVDEFPIRALWSVRFGEIFNRVVPATGDSPARIETNPALVMGCAGWGGGQAGSLSGICQFLPDSGELTVVLRDGSEAIYAPVGKDPKSYRIGNFRSPIMSGSGQNGFIGIVFAYADCGHGSNDEHPNRCLVASGIGQSTPRIVFMNGADESQGWQIKMVEIDQEMTVEEIPEAKGWTAYLHVSKDGADRLATATVMLDGGQSTLQVSADPWVN